MRLLHETRFDENRPPASWEFEVACHRMEENHLCAGNGTLVRIPLPGDGWRALRVELEVEPAPQAAIECCDGALAVNLMFREPLACRHDVRKHRHLLGESTRPIPPRAGFRAVRFDFADGCWSGTVDGEEMIRAADPAPRPVMRWITLRLIRDCRVKSVRILGDHPLPTPPPRPPAPDFFLEVTVDIFDDLIRAPFNQKMFNDLFAEFRAWGVRRCHWIHCGERRDGFWDHCPFGAAQNAAKTFDAVGDMLPAAVRAAHAQGIELIGLIKPLELGLRWSYGEGTPEARARGRVPRIGGPVSWICRFVPEHPELLTVRRPGTCGEAINSVFDRIDLVKEDDRPAAFTVEQVELLVSDDNATYHPYNGPMQREEVIEEYPVYVHTPSGGKPSGAARRCRVMRLKGLDLRQKYFALAVPEGRSSFTNTLVNLLHVFGEKGEERRLTYANQRRWDEAERLQDFRRAGFEFDHYFGTPTNCFAGYDVITEPWTLDGREGFIGIARGKDPGPLAHFSPFFPAAREIWLGWAREALDAGADGVEFRVRNHHSDFAWAEYGFEAPMVEAFRTRYGVDLLSTDDFDRAAFRRLRGEAYTQFYREARRLARARGKSMGLHVSITMDMEPEEGAAMETHWDWRTWLDEGLADSVTMKEVWPGTWFAEEILARTRARGIPAIFSPYNVNPRGPELIPIVDDHIRNARQGGYGGYQFYECAAAVRATPDGRVVMDRPDLRDLFRRHFVR